MATREGTRHALVVAPDHDEIVGTQTLKELRSGRPTTLFLETLAERVALDPMPIDVVLLRARGADGSGQFRMSRDLEDGELEEVGYRLARAQLQAWRPLLRKRILAVARVELRVWELAALRSGTARLLAEIDRRALAPGSDGARQAAEDRWILRHSVLNFGVGLDTAVNELLPTRLAEVEAARRAAAAAACVEPCAAARP